jgi:hypothetical protein
MIIQTNAEMFYRNRPVHTVTNIDRSKSVVHPERFRRFVTGCSAGFLGSLGSDAARDRQ